MRAVRYDDDDGEENEGNGSERVEDRPPYSRPLQHPATQRNAPVAPPTITVATGLGQIIAPRFGDYFLPIALSPKKSFGGGNLKLRLTETGSNNLVRPFARLA